MSPFLWRLLAGVLILAASPAPLLAQDAATAEEEQQATDDEPQAEPATPDAPAPRAKSRRRRQRLFERATLLDDAGGVRPALGELGIELGIGYDADVLGNFTGGRRQGAIYEGLLQLDLDVDAEKAIGLAGLTLHATAYQIHGQGLTASHVGNLMTVSDSEATRATRLSTLYLEQTLAGGAVSLRAGQLAADDEFLITEYGVPLVNATFGWPEITGADLPSGGPAYPLGTPGIRARVTVAEGLSVAAALFNGDPVGPGTGDPQARDPSGTAFRLGDDAFAIAELAYQVSEKRRPSGLSGTYKLGGWYHSGSFPDQRFDAGGRSLADPASSGIAATRGTNFGAYGVVDQMLWRHATRHGEWVGGFFRLSGSPGDRNPIDLYADTGLTANGVVPGREFDIVSLGLAYARASRAARALDRDARAASGGDLSLRDFEGVVELSYQLHFAPWLIVQPDLQLVIHPGAHAAAKPSGAPLGDAVVGGVRTVLRF